MSRIFCIGKNYHDHVLELAPLGYAPDGDCVIFMKPITCLVPVGSPLVLPKNQGSVHHEAELVLCLGHGGQNIPEDQALDCISHFTLGLDLTLRDLQTQLKAKGKPWELAKAFDGAAPIGEWLPVAGRDLSTLHFSLRVNGEVRQQGFTGDMLYAIPRQISILSQTWALQPGDIVYTGTPAGVAALVSGDVATLTGDGLPAWSWTCQ